MVAAFVRFQMKTAAQIRFVNVISSGLFGIHYALLSAWSGSAVFFLASGRSAILLTSTGWKYKIYILWASVALCVLVSYFTYEHWYDIFPLLALCLGGLLDIQAKAIVSRGLGVLMHSCWFVFAILNGSQGGTVSTSLSIGSNLLGFWRHQLYPYLKTRDKSYFDI